MSKTTKMKQFKQRNFIAMDLCTKSQFRSRVQANKKKKLSKFNLAKEMRNYSSERYCSEVFV